VPRFLRLLNFPSRFFKRLRSRLKRALRPRVTRFRARLQDRPTAIPTPLLLSIQEGTSRYEHEGVTCVKDPFDLALYTMLISRLRPLTIVEIGSFHGGSAKWFATQLRGMQIPGHVYSLDLEKVEGVTDSAVDFLQGDVHHLEQSPLPTLLSDRRGPLLVVEDGPHTYNGSLAALRFFHPYLTPGDYIVVEDGNVGHLGKASFQDGPNRAVREFLAEFPGQYEVDLEICDFYGTNVTWNTDGYLRRVA